MNILGDQFPREAFVQKNIERHFSELGFTSFHYSFTDLACQNHETGETWIIEAKGETSATGLDFRTGLGQLLQSMQDKSFRYGIAVPKTEKFKNQVARLSDWVRYNLCLHIIYVDENGTVEILDPANE